MTSKFFLIAGSVSAMLAVLIGAFGAHGLKNHLTEHYLTVYKTGVDYHFYHALGLIIIGIILNQFPPDNYIKWSGILMLAGIILFSGSLYALSISQIRWLGAITPIGGAAFIGAWVCLLISFIKNNP